MAVTVIYPDCTPCCGTPGVATTCCPARILPVTLIGRIRIVNTQTGAWCACAGGVGGTSLPATWDAEQSKWIGTAPLGTCGKNITLRLRCAPSGAFFMETSFEDDCLPASTTINGSKVCDPFFTGGGYVVFSSNGCGCTGSPQMNIFIDFSE